MKTFERIQRRQLEVLETPWESDAGEAIRGLRQAREAREPKKIVAVGDIAVNTIIGVLKENGNYRSPGMIEDMRKTAALMDRIVNGVADPKYYLCDLPTGTGKTSLLTLYAYLLSEMRNDGVLICVPQIREIEELVQRLTFFGAKKKQIYVYTSDAEANSLGCPPDKGNDAPICITTQQMVESRLFNVKRFEDLREFHFRHRSRALRLWDEALIPWQELVLTVYEIARLPYLVQGYNPELASRLLDVSEDVRKIEGGRYQFPDLVTECGFKHENFKKDVLAWRKNPEKDRGLIRTLVSLCDKTVRVSKDQNLNTVLSWKNHIPDDFLPALVFDASGRVRSMYDRYAASTKKLEIITKATKRYDNVTFHHVNMAGSKSGWRTDPEKLFGATLHCINNEPDRKCLVVHHKEDDESTFNPSRRYGGKVPDIETEVRGQAKNPDAVSFLAWGTHKQTNQFEELDKIVLPGLFYLPQRTIEVRTRGSNQLSHDDAVRAESLREIELGELKNDILQAVGRICIRRCERGENGEEQAPKADVYVFASNRAGYSIPELLRDLFPGCKVKNHSVPGAKRRKAEMALDALDKWTAGRTDVAISHAEIMEDVGISDQSNFTKIVRNDPVFQAGLKDRHVQDDGKTFHKRF